MRLRGAAINDRPQFPQADLPDQREAETLAGRQVTAGYQPAAVIVSYGEHDNA